MSVKRNRVEELLYLAQSSKPWINELIDYSIGKPWRRCIDSSKIANNAIFKMVNGG